MKKIRFLIVILLFIFSLGVYDILSSDFSLFGTNSKQITIIKNKIKDVIFYIPSKMKKADELDKINKILIEEKRNNSESILSFYKYSKNLQSFNLLKKKSENIFSKNDLEYKIIYYELPLLDYYNSKGKPVGYIEKYYENLIIISGDGQIFSFDEKDIGKNKINLKRIKSNINEFSFFELINQQGEISIRDVEIFKEDIFFSVINKDQDDCYNLQLYKAPLNELKNFVFEVFYSLDECLKPSNNLEFNIGQSGGRIIFVNDNLILSTGGFRTRTKPQDLNSLYGKILKIDLKSKTSKIISIGHRNIQGLTESNGVIISSEHGPAGGDEINVHKNLLHDSHNILNYGWPISSYGKHYTSVIQKHKSNNTYKQLINIAPLYKSHKEYGFEEPIKFFAPESIAISEIEFSNKQFDKNFTNDIYVGALRNNPTKYAKLYHFKFNKDFDKINYEDEILLKKRIRDLKLYDKNLYLMLESIPSLGIINKIN